MPKPSPKTKTNVTQEEVGVKNLIVTLANRRILDGVSFGIPKGHIAAIIGPNGSGKTTLIKAMLGLIASTGDISYFGKSLSEQRRSIGYVPQKFSFTPDLPITVEEFMELARSNGTTDHDLHHALHEVGLPHRVHGAPLATLSGGQLQRVLIAQAIMNHPDILFLDEPSNNIDASGEATFYDIITHLNKEHGTTVVMVSHDIGTIASIVDTVICINGKLLCAGAPRKVLTQHNLEALFGKDATLYGHSHHSL